MSKGFVDGTVKNREFGEEILSALLPDRRPGTVVRVTSMAVRVDKSGVLRYTQEESERREGPVQPSQSRS